MSLDCRKAQGENGNVTQFLLWGNSPNHCTLWLNSSTSIRDSLSATSISYNVSYTNLVIQCNNISFLFCKTTILRKNVSGHKIFLQNVRNGSLIFQIIPQTQGYSYTAQVTLWHIDIRSCKWLSKGTSSRKEFEPSSHLRTPCRIMKHNGCPS